MHEKKRNRYWGLTVSYNKDGVGTDILNYIENLLKSKDIHNYTYACSNLEIGDETEYLHYHLMFRFENAVQYNFIKDIFGDIHIENIAHPKAYLDYISKTGLLFCNINLTNKENIYKSILDDIENGFTLKQIVYKYPNYCMTHFTQIKSLYDYLKFNDK